MSAATQQPVVPPRPVRKQDAPPRHLFNRSVSPNPDRFAPSPINESPFSANKSPNRSQFSPPNGGMHPPSSNNHIGRPPSVDLPMVGEEGNEYALIADELNNDAHSPEHTRTVGDELKIHAPKPSLPTVSAKQRIATVTRTDSDRAASFGIGKPSLEDSLAHLASSNRSLKKKASTTSQLSASERVDTEDEHGIPEIGLQVPMYKNAGDVQAPSPAPHMMSAPGTGTGTPTEGAKRHHKRKGSSRGFEELPPGSYGLHGHGVKSTDKLDQAYYDKHPELAKLEHHHYQHDRATDFSMSSEDLNKIVRGTASRGSGLGTHDLPGTPSEQIGWKVTDELTSRVTSPRPASIASKGEKSSLSKVISHQSEASETHEDDFKDVNVIHVDDPNAKRRSVMFSDEETYAEDDERYNAPILADDEVAKDPSPYHHTPAVEPPRERRGSAHEMEESNSRPTSRPASLYKESSFDDFRSTPLDDVKEYEPLFPEDEKAARKAAAKKLEQYKQRFPSRDIWEDAPNSVHYTAEVHTPDVPGEEEAKLPDVPDRSCETPAQAFARQQEELAEKESRGDPEAFHHRKPAKPPAPWAHQAHIANEVAASRPSPARRFPSRDVWEDTPDSAHLSTTVSTPQRESEPELDESNVPEVPQRPARKQSTEPSSATSDKPVIPERPKPKQTPSGDSSTSKPVIPDRPKPQVPARPAKKLSGSDKDTPVGDAPASEPRSKPAVPARPVGSKIAALQAGFMSDLNKKLGLGPQAPKKEEPAEEEPAEEQEKAPLVDARKGRARGPQRRAPKASPSPAAKPADEAPKLTFTMTTTLFSIDPEEGNVSCDLSDAPKPAEEDVEVKKVAAAPVEKDVSPVEQKPTAEPEEDKVEEKEVDTEEKPQSLVTNTAGETVLETKLAAPTETKDDAVEPVAAAEVAKD